jgi:hypothetical protein
MWDWTRVGEDLDADEAGCSRHVNMLRGLIKQKDQWELNWWMHHDLTVLDDKTASILQVNSIGIASLTLYLGGKTEHTQASTILTIVSFALMFIAIIRLLRIPYVYWSSTHQFQHPDEMFCTLLTIRNKRSRIVRASIVLISWAIPCFVAAIVLDVVLPVARAHWPHH